MEYITLNRELFQEYMEEFSKLYTLCFNVPMDAKEVAWRYLDNPNKEILACIAVDKGKLVANYSASPIYLIKDGKPVKIALSLNTMTHPDYMGQGLFVKLASSVYRYMDEKGYRMIMGFPNNISNRTFINKLGWSDILTKPTLAINLETVSKKSVKIFATAVRDDEFIFDYSQCIDHKNGICVYKTKEYLQWRYYHNPAIKYYNLVIHNSGCVSSRVILKEFRDRINIVDAYFRNEDEEKVLINAAIEFGINKNKKMLTVWLKLGSWEHLVLESYGCIMTSPVTYFGLNVFKKEDDFSDYYQPGNWYLNLSDDNVY